MLSTTDLHRGNFKSNCRTNMANSYWNSCGLTEKHILAKWEIKCPLYPSRAMTHTDNPTITVGNGKHNSYHKAIYSPLLQKAYLPPNYTGEWKRISLCQTDTQNFNLIEKGLLVIIFSTSLRNQCIIKQKIKQTFWTMLSKREILIPYYKAFFQTKLHTPNNVSKYG